MGGDALVAALSKTKLLVALWLDRRSPDAIAIDDAESALPLLSELFGDDHPVLAETRAAILAATQQAGAGHCEQLRRLQKQIDSFAQFNEHVRNRLGEYMRAGSQCGARPK